MAIIQLPGLDMSNSQKMRNKAWIKRLDSVDRSKKDGYAFVGSFEKFEATVEVQVGTWFLMYAEDRRASGRLDGIMITLYRVGDDGLTEAEKWNLDGTAGWALRVRDEIAALVNVPLETTSPKGGETALKLLVVKMGDDFQICCMDAGCGTSWEPARGDELLAVFGKAVVHCTGHVE